MLTSCPMELLNGYNSQSILMSWDSKFVLFGDGKMDGMYVHISIIILIGTKQSCIHQYDFCLHFIDGNNCQLILINTLLAHIPPALIYDENGRVK